MSDVDTDQLAVPSDKNALEAAVAAERARWTRVRELALMCAEWHIGDGDECGEVARELYQLLKS